MIAMLTKLLAAVNQMLSRRPAAHFTTKTACIEQQTTCIDKPYCSHSSNPLLESTEQLLGVANCSF